MQGSSRRLFLVVGIIVLLFAGASYTWTFTLSYSPSPLTKPSSIPCTHRRLAFSYPGSDHGEWRRLANILAPHPLTAVSTQQYGCVDGSSFD
jgi:hypothetical protein